MLKHLLPVAVLSLVSVQWLYGQAPADTAKLPFAIAKEKRLSDEDLANKKEGAYVTGVPDLSSDPINGFGYGGEVSVYFNGKKTDPFFAYTPYRAKVDITAFNTTREQREFMAKLDMPFAFNTRWRFRVEGGYESNPNLLYFGINESSLNGLTYYPGNDSTKTPVTNARYSDYNTSLSGPSALYNNYHKKEYILNVSAERSYFGNKLRALIGFEYANVEIKALNENAKILRDKANEGILGIGRYGVTIAQLGLIYDTRDLETDPGSGAFGEITNELSLQALGSKFNFNKTFVHYNIYRRLFPKAFKKLVLAARTAWGYTAGDAPFFEYQDQWSSEGSIEGLGGENTIRGYKQGRFLGRVMNFNNLELRYRFAQTHVLKQHIAFSAVPFFDVGGVWNDAGRIFTQNNFRYAEGLGLRIAWNVNTILRFDYAVSQEDAQFFFKFGHTF